MIQSFGGDATADIFHGKNTKAARAFDRRLWPAMVRKLDAVNAASAMSDLKVPPGHRLEALKGDQAGRHSIRINEQYRISFRFEKGHAHEVTCEDYH